MATTTTRLALSKPAASDLVSAFQATVGTSFDTIDADIVASQGAYAGGTTYHAFDVVTSGGLYYMSTATQTGAAPPGSNWRQIAFAQIAAATDIVEGLITLGLFAEGENWPLNLGTGILTTTGVPVFNEISTRAEKTAGALTAFTITASAQQVDASQDRFVSGSIHNTSAAGAVSLTVQLSPDNSTFTAVATIACGGTTLDGTVNVPFGVYVPKGWWLMVSNLTNAAADAGVAY